MLYFAYGSNINLDHLTAYLDTHGVKLDTELTGQHACLHNFRLRTNYFAGSHGAGACNIEPSQNQQVEGVVMTISKTIQDILRVKEGFSARYREIEVEVHTASTQAPVRALTYVVTEEFRLDVDLPVTTRYRDLILDGAKHFDFSKAYQESLRNKLWIAPTLSFVPQQNATHSLK